MSPLRIIAGVRNYPAIFYGFLNPRRALKALSDIEAKFSTKQRQHLEWRELEVIVDFVTHVARFSVVIHSA